MRSGVGTHHKQALPVPAIRPRFDFSLRDPRLTFIAICALKVDSVRGALSAEGSEFSPSVYWTPGVQVGIGKVARGHTHETI